MAGRHFLLLVTENYECYIDLESGFPSEIGVVENRGEGRIPLRWSIVTLVVMI
jgi:hypothetical protein